MRQRVTQLVQLGAQWALIAVPLVMGVLIGVLVWLVVVWWRALMRGYVIGRVDEHP